MTLSSLGGFFKKLAQYAPTLLLATPLAVIADDLIAAIAEAEALFGPGSGAQKLQHVLNIAVEAMEALGDLNVHVLTADDVRAIGTPVIAAIIAVVNAANKPKAA